MAEGVRLRSLDSLRGIAALIVVIYHGLLSLPGWGEDRSTLLHDGFSSPRAWIYLTPLRLVASGPAAVMIFFALSGLVLSMNFIERDREHYAFYVIKRVTRIWPAFAIAIIISAILEVIFGSAKPSGMSEWFAYTWMDRLTPALLLEHLAMLGNVGMLDNPMWSLVHEMRISLIFPCLVFCTLANWRLSLAGSIVLAIVAVKLVGIFGNNALAQSLLMTMVVAWLFIAGIVVAIRLQPVRLYMRALPPWAFALLWMAALVGIAWAPESTERIGMLRDGLLMLTSGAAAVAIVMLCTVEGRIFRALLGPIPVYLGRISYSLYLLHVVTITTAVYALEGLAPLPILVLAGAAASIPLADLLQRTVEKPISNWGRRLVGQTMQKVAA